MAIITRAAKGDALTYAEMDTNITDLRDRPDGVVRSKEVIDKVEIKQLSKAYNYQRKLYHADQVGNIERVIAIYKELQQREEDDIELILIGS